MRIKPNKNKMVGVNSRFASVSESIFIGFLLKMLLRSLSVYIHVLKQLFFSISVNSGRIFTSISKNKILLNIILRVGEWSRKLTVIFHVFCSLVF